MYATPLKFLVENSKLNIAVVLNSFFKIVSKVTKTPMSIIDLKKVTDICNIPIAIKNNQDVHDLFITLQVKMEITHYVKNVTTEWNTKTRKSQVYFG